VVEDPPQRRTPVGQQREADPSALEVVEDRTDLRVQGPARRLEEHVVDVRGDLGVVALDAEVVEHAQVQPTPEAALHVEVTEVGGGLVGVGPRDVVVLPGRVEGLAPVVDVLRVDVQPGASQARREDVLRRLAAGELDLDEATELLS
jgi:hypothetical protein